MRNLTLTRVNYNDAPPLKQYKDHSIFQTKEWLDFISHMQNAEPVIAVVKEGEFHVGRFTGLIIRRYGLRILGSPFPGWTTSYMGFNLDSSVSYVDALVALKDFAFHELRCAHIEIRDRYINISHFKNAGYLYFASKNASFEIDLSLNEDAIFDAMESSCRRCIRKSNKLGVKIEVSFDSAFAYDYYAQLKDVFAKQSLIPTYPIERVRSLIECMLPTGHLLLLRAKNDLGICIATGIFPGFNDTMYFWGGASWRHYQNLRPNEAIQWFAMRFWKAKGIKKYDMGGSGEYKRKYGAYEIYIPWGRKSRNLLIDYFRNISKGLFIIKQHISGLGKH